nr:hypothetical protein [Rhodococcus sp. 15-649-1-2]
MEKLPAGRPAGHPNLLNQMGNGIVGFVAGAIFDGLDGATGGIFNLGKLADRMRGTEQTAQQAAETAAAASNLAVLYNFDVAANRAKYPAVAPFTFPAVNYAVSGSNVALLTAAPGYPANASQRLGPDFRVTPEEKIYVEWRQRRIDANYLARVNIVILDADGAVIQSESPIVAGEPALAVQPDATATNNAWAQYSGVVTIPVGAVSAIPQLRMQSSAGLDLSGSWAFDNVVIRRAVTADLTAIQAQLAGKANYEDIPTNVPLWQNVNPSDDSVFPYSMLVYVTNATTSSNGNTTTSESKIPTFSSSSGEMDIGYIRSVRDREYTQVGFMTAKGAIIGSGPFEIWVHVYKMNPTSGLLTLVWASGNLKSAVQAAGSGKMLRFAMPQIHADQGDVFAVGIVQRANVLNPSYSIYGIEQPYTDQPAGVHPRGLGSRANVGTTFPSASTIASASQVWTDENTPWFFLG